MGITDGTVHCALCGEDRTSCSLCGTAPLTPRKPSAEDYAQQKYERDLRMIEASNRRKI